MNKKAQLELGLIILTFVGVIVALAIFTGGITGSVGDVSTLGSINVSSSGTNTGRLTLVDDTAQNLAGKAVSNFRMMNVTVTLIPLTTNYTLANNLIDTNGDLTAQVTPLTGTVAFYGALANVSYIYQPVTYISDAGGRSIASLILIFAVLAIAMVALVPALRGLAAFK